MLVIIRGTWLTWQSTLKNKKSCSGSFRHAAREAGFNFDKKNKHFTQQKTITTWLHLIRRCYKSKGRLRTGWLPGPPPSGIYRYGQRHELCTWVQFISKRSRWIKYHLTGDGNTSQLFSFLSLYKSNLCLLYNFVSPKQTRVRQHL